MDPFIGEIRMAGFGFAPQGWVACDGSLLSVKANTALFSLLGTTFGGDGQSTFGVPDLRGRVPVCQGQGTGLQAVSMGQVGGEQTVTLTSDQMPSHTHMVAPVCTSGDALSADPSGGIPANGGTSVYADGGSANGVMVAAQSTVAGGSGAHDNMPPYQAVNFFIATQGIFPSRP